MGHQIWLLLVWVLQLWLTTLVARAVATAMVTLMHGLFAEIMVHVAFVSLVVGALVLLCVAVVICLVIWIIWRTRVATAS